MAQISEKVVKNLLKKYKIRPVKRLGQNFLINKSVVRKIMAAANINPRDIILEIGPGTGTLTKELAKKAGKVIAIEKDPKMVEILREELKEFKNIKIIQGDILKISNFQFLISKYKVVANLPYYIVSPVLRKFLENKSPPKEMILMTQKEVAQRICARPHRYAKRCGRVKPPQMNSLAVSVQFYAKPRIISFVSKKSFWPQPKVDSAIIKITPFAWAHSHFANRRRASAFHMLFFKIVRAGFSSPRKQIINNLSKGLKVEREKIKKWLLKSGVQPERRAETLEIKDWLRLTRTFTF